MPININKENIKMRQLVAKDTFVTWLEQDVLVPDTKPDVIKVVKVDAVPYISKLSIQDGVVRISGNLTYYILYRPSTEEKLKGISLSYPFSQNIPVKSINENMKITVKPSIRNVVYSVLNERKISLKSELVIKYNIFDLNEIQVPTSIEGQDDIELIQKTQELEEIVAFKDENIEIKEEIVIDNAEGTSIELLSAKATINDKEYKVSYNKVLVKGMLVVKLRYLTGENNINTYTTSIPYAGMVEVENVSEDTQTINVEHALTGFNVSLGGIDSNVATVEANVTALVTVAQPKTVPVIMDMYSTKSEIEYATNKTQIVKNISKCEKEIRLNETIASVKEGTKIVDYSIDTEGINYSVAGGNVYLSGNVKATVMLEKENSDVIEAQTYELPIDTTIMCNNSLQYIDVELEIKNSAIQIIQNAINVDITIYATILTYNIEDINSLEISNEKPIDEGDFDSMYIYIVKKDDTLWSIAKKYKTTVAKIANVNNIVDENKIDIGQKLLLIR